MADVWIEKKPKAKRGPHRGKVRYKVRYREYTGEGLKTVTRSEIFSTKSAAEKCKDDWMAGDLPKDKVTMAELAEDFIVIECKPHRRKEATAKDYRSIISNHIKRHIGSIKVEALTARDVHRMTDKILTVPISRHSLHKTQATRPESGEQSVDGHKDADEICGAKWIDLWQSNTRTEAA